MGLRFRRSIKVLSGVRLNLSKSGIGISAGVRGLHVGVDAKARKYTSGGIPGKGLSSRQYIGQIPTPERARLAAGERAVGSFGVLILAIIAAAVGAVVIFAFLSR